ncbi:MAG: NAD(P)H-binding protein [Ginsengibacter sp.]
MNELTAVVIGASGLTGGYVVEELLKDNAFGMVRILARKHIQLIHPRLQQETVNFDDINDYTRKFGEGDIIFCCIGTTQKKVKGDMVAYEKIDFDIPVNAGRIGIEKSYKKFLIISSVGANVNSSNFYLKLKGKTENALKQFAFENICFFRPSMLLGERKEQRRGEKILQNSMKFFSRLLFGSLKKYHAINAKDVAKAMVKVSKQFNHGVQYFEYSDIMSLA